MMDKTEIQELLFAVVPLWNYKVMKPFKQSLETGTSMDMYYCIQILRLHEKSMKMNEIASQMNMSKQQTTKLIDNMVEHKLVERVYDEKDRRVINIQATKYSKQYIDYFLKEKVSCFDTLLLDMNEEDKIHFKNILQELFMLLMKDTKKKE